MQGRGHAALTAALALAIAQGAATGASAVDGVIEINQSRAEAGGVTASDTPGFPVTLDAAGSYRLTGNLETPGGNAPAAIEITASAVSLDLNGFRISCEPGAPCFSGGFSGIQASASVHSVRVANGIIDGMDGDGIDLPGIRNSVDRVQVLGFDTETAIRLGNHCRITDSRMGNGQGGGFVGSDCYVRGLLASQGSNGRGLGGGDNVTVVDSMFIGHSNGEGLDLGDNASVVNVTADDNAGPGIVVGAGSVVKDCRARSNLGAGIQAVSGTITGNAVEGNQSGIVVSGSASVVSNTIVGNGLEGLQAPAGTGYGSNVINDNNGGNANPQVSGGIEIGPNVCGGDTTCP